MTLKRYSIIISSLMLLSSVANAQLLEITARDTTGLADGMVCNHGDFQPVHFIDGRYTYDTPSVVRYQDAVVMAGREMFNVVLEKGETLHLQLVRKNGKLTAEYKGKNSDAARFINSLISLSAHGWQNITVDENDDEIVTLNKDFDFAAEEKRIETAYPDVQKLARKVKDTDLQKQYLHRAFVALLYSKIAIIDAQEQMAGRNADRNHNADIEALISQIDPNDTVMDGHGLVGRFIDSKRTHFKDEPNLTPMALEYITLIDKYITNEKIRYNHFNELASSMFNAEGANFVLDTFWSAYCKSAPKRLVNYYQTVVDSKKATTTGTPCPDATFSDIDGNTHHLSEFFYKGKYLFIDLWATWCIPCCAEIPYVAEHVKHYADNDRIQFISISLDSDHEAWRKKLNKDKPEWPQFVTNKEENNKLCKDWGITGIPRFLIINPDGTINNASALRPSAHDFYQQLDKIIKK